MSKEANKADKGGGKEPAPVMTRDNRVAVPLSDKAHEHFSREAAREGRVISRQLAWYLERIAQGAKLVMETVICVAVIAFWGFALATIPFSDAENEAMIKTEVAAVKAAVGIK